MEVDWLSLFKTTERELESIVIAARGMKKGGAASVKDKRTSIKRFEECGASVSRLSALLENAEDDESQPIGLGELQRRRGQLANLKGFLENTRTLLKESGNSGNPRADLFQGPVETSSTRTQDFGGSSVELLSLNEQKLAEQDKTLDVIDDGLQRLKAMSHNLNSELDLHITLLQDLDESVEASNRRMVQTARRVDAFSDGGTENNCGPIVMGVLCGVMVLFSITDVACLLKPCR
jgi:uncharacterized coiled-coil protein SlyX